MIVFVALYYRTSYDVDKQINKPGQTFGDEQIYKVLIICLLTVMF